MKTILSLAFVLFLASLSAETIITLKGEKFEQATVTGVSPAALSITHAAGVAVIPFEELPGELQTKYHYDRAKAEAWRQAQAAADRTAVANEAAARKAEALAKWRADYNAKRQGAMDRAWLKWAVETGNIPTVYDPATKQFYNSEAEAARARTAWFRALGEARHP